MTGEYDNIEEQIEQAVSNARSLRASVNVVMFKVVAFSTIPEVVGEKAGEVVSRLNAPVPPGMVKGMVKAHMMDIMKRYIEP